MTIWWYAEKGQKYGPFEQNAIEKLVQSGRIGPETLLWKKGMDQWLRLAEIEELQTLKVSSPPPLPLPLDISYNTTNYQMAGRWPRFFARIFDVWLEFIIVSFITGMILGFFSINFEKWIDGEWGDLLSWLIILPIALILDAIIYKIFGHTPGKALLGIRVISPSSSDLNFDQYLRRNFSMWVDGFALGIPFINLLTMSKQYTRLGKGQQTNYDDYGGYQVRSDSIRLWRKLAFGILFFALFLFLSILNAIGQKYQTTQTEKRIPKSYTWINPDTGLAAQIDSRWNASTEKNDNDQKYYVFSEEKDRAIVILAVENIPKISLSEYAILFQANTSDSMKFEDTGSFFEKSEKEFWKNTGSVIDKTSNRLDIKVVKIGDNFWRVVTIQCLPYEYSDNLVKRIQSELWNAVF